MHVADGIQFVRDIRNSLADANVSGGDQNNNDSSNTKHPLNGNHNASHAETRNFTRVDILVIDVDSSDSRWIQIDISASVEKYDLHFVLKIYVSSLLSMQLWNDLSCCRFCGRVFSFSRERNSFCTRTIYC